MGIDRWAASQAGSRVWAQRPMARNSVPEARSPSGNCRPGSDRQRFGGGAAIVMVPIKIASGDANAGS